MGRRLSSPSTGTTVEKHDPYAAIRQPAFVLFTTSRVFSTVGQTLLQAVILWQVYDIADSALSLGFIGLIRFLPALCLSLAGGAAADTYNRKVLVLIAQAIPLSCAAVLATATFGGWVNLELIYFAVLMLGVASAFDGPARQSLLPAIVRPETFQNAVTVSQTLQALGMLVGPAFGAGIIAVAGVGVAYSVYVAFAAAAFVTLSLVKYKQIEGQRRGVSLEAVLEGIAFVRTRQVLIGSMSLDMFAVLFGGAEALLPIYAKDILHAGPVGYGILFSSLSGGALIMSFLMVFRPPVVNTGKTLIWSVVAFGAFTVLFGLSHIFVLSVVFYACLGAADEVSMVMRSTTIQLATPDELRGRVSAVSMIFINASNQVGAMESGFVAALTSATFAVVSGGFGAIGVAGFIGWRLKDLYQYRIPRPGSLVVEAIANVPSTRETEVEGEAEKQKLIEEIAPAAGGS